MRAIFDDDLLASRGCDLALTARAAALSRPLDGVLAAIDACWSLAAGSRRDHAWCRDLLARAARRVTGEKSAADPDRRGQSGVALRANPNSPGTVKGYAAHEHGLFEDLADKRAQSLAAGKPHAGCSDRCTGARLSRRGHDQAAHAS